MRQVRLKIKGKWSGPYPVRAHDGFIYIHFDYGNFYSVPVSIDLLRALGVDVMPVADKLPENVIPFPKKTKRNA